MPPNPKPRAPKRPNPIAGRNRPPPSKNPTIFTERAKVRPPKPACANPDCKENNIEDGTCQSCGWVIDDSNIVAEIQFGESSSGAAIVQGTFLGADQGGSRSQGMPGQRGNGGNSKQTLEEGTLFMKSIAAQLSIRESTVKDAVEVFKLAQSENFIQGRRISEVAAVSLYVSCRRNPPCKVMLIEFSDKINVNVFRLGRVFHDLQEKCCLSRQLTPVVPEDLMRRFAMKLEFGDDLDKVCESAIRFCQRMELDWISMGRRPSGICGAALVMAARMHNYRRTLKEVVYVVKITSTTLQKRLVEFMRTSSSNLTLEEFRTNEFLSTQHDPPSFYQNSPEFLREKEKKRNKKRKRTGPVLVEEELLEAEQEKRRESERALEQENRRDADGFAIPAIPSSSRLPRPNFDRSNGANVDPNFQAEGDLVDHALHDQGQLDRLVDTFDEQLRPEEKERKQQEEQEKREENRRQEEARKSRLAPSTQDSPTDSGSGAMHGTADGLNDLLSQILMDPHSLEGALHHAEAEERVKHRMIIARENEKHVNMDVDIGEDEFEDDPDVANSILSPDDVARKERVWLNANKAWLLKEQKKKHDAELALQQPPVKKRNRVKKAKMGEGQTEPAASPGEATSAVANNREFSKKVNYEVAFVYNQARYGSRAGSIMGSAAGSERGSEPPGREESVEPRAQSAAVESVAREPTRSPSMQPAESEVSERARPANIPDPEDEDVEMAEADEEVAEVSEEEYPEEEYQEDAGYDDDGIPDINVSGYDDDDD